MEEITTKLAQLELRNYQANESAIANMKREAKEEREKIIKTQKELEAQVKVSNNFMQVWSYFD